MNSKNTKFVHRLIISYSILLLIILAMGAYLYTLSISNVSREIRTQNKFMLNKSIHDMEGAFKTMDVLAGQVVSNSNITQLANKADNRDNSFYLMAYHAKEELSVYVFTESILPIKNYFIFLEQSEYILSLAQFSNTQLYYSGIKNYYKDKYEDWLSLLKDDASYRRFVSIDPFKSYSDSTYLYKLPLTEYSIKKVPAIICFEIDYGQLKDLFSEISLYNSGAIYVTDQNNQPVFTIQGTDATAFDAEQLSRLTFKNGFSTMVHDGIDMFVTKATSKYNQWNYYLIQPEDMSLYSLKQYRNIFIGIIVVALCIELLVVLYLSRSNIKKITQLGNELSDTQSHQKNLQKLVEVQKPIIMNTYLDNIFKGTIATSQELDYVTQYLAIDPNDKKFTVLFIVAYVNQYEFVVDNSAVTGPDSLDYQDIINDALHSFFKNLLGSAHNNEKEYTLLLSSDSNEVPSVSNTAVKQAFDAFHEHLLKNYDIWTIAGLGDWNNGLMITWKSFQQANQSVNYATKRAPFRCYSNVDHETNGFYYPIELMNQLTGFITSGNQSQVLEIFEIIRHENLEKRSLPINIMKFLLSDIRNTLYKVRFSLTITEENEAAVTSIDMLFEEHKSLKLFEDLAIRLCELYDNTGTNNKLINTIKSYIDANYQDPSLCLTKISDEFSISESYFSYLFKEEIGENFSNYLERHRMEHAYALIKDSDMNISNIYKEVGYNNSHTFRRAFKKIYGVSPKDTRQQGKTN